MKKKLLISLFMLIVLIVPTQCFAYQITVLGPSNEVILEKELKAEKNDTVYSGLLRTGIKHINSPGQYGAYITSIGNISYEESGGWCVFVNKTFINKSIDNWPLKDTDQVLFYTVNGHGWQEYPNYSFPASKNISTSIEVKTPGSIDKNQENIEVNEILKSLDLSTVESNSKNSVSNEKVHNDTQEVDVSESNIVSNVVEERNIVETSNYKNLRIYWYNYSFYTWYFLYKIY